MSASLCTLKEGMSYTKQLPSKGLSQSQVLDKIREYETLSKCALILARAQLRGALFTQSGSKWKVSFVCLADEVDWEKGCVSGAVYWGDESLTKLLVKVGILSLYCRPSTKLSLKGVDLPPRSPQSARFPPLRLLLMSLSRRANIWSSCKFPQPFPGLWRFCVEQPAPPGHLSRREEDGG